MGATPHPQPPPYLPPVPLTDCSHSPSRPQPPPLIGGRDHRKGPGKVATDSPQRAQRAQIAP